MIKKYFKIVVIFCLAFVINAMSPSILGFISHAGGEGASIALTLWTISLILGTGWVCAEYSKGTVFPSFTLQLLVSIVLHDALAPLTNEVTLIVVICTVLAAIILKSGGDEVERQYFKKIALPTILISTLGYLITFFVTLFLLLLIGIDTQTAMLLSAIIGSTDPAALIPTVNRVVFSERYKNLTNISVAESAINDATGAIFTGAVIVMLQSGTDVSSLGKIFSGVFETHNLIHFGSEILFGVIAGFIGWLMMWMYEKHKSLNHEASYDFAVILAVPIFTFLIAWFMGGNGFLAAFIAGLMANYNHGNHKFEKTLAAMEMKIDSIAKPAIFMMAGPLISIHDLWETAGIGLAISLLFMFVARPIAVFGSLAFTKMSVKEKLFLSSVRETGVIPIAVSYTHLRAHET
jgi:NhaP-type Na+/H+ or K+/H+ antiporter